MMQQKKNGNMDPNALKGLIDSLSQMADMPHADTHIVGTGMNKMCLSSGGCKQGLGNTALALSDRLLQNTTYNIRSS